MRLARLAGRCTGLSDHRCSKCIDDLYCLHGIAQTLLETGPEVCSIPTVVCQVIAESRELIAQLPQCEGRFFDFRTELLGLERVVYCRSPLYV